MITHRCYKNLYDHKNVVADCTESLMIDPSNWKAQMRRGYAYQGLEKYRHLQSYTTQDQLIDPRRRSFTI